MTRGSSLQIRTDCFTNKEDKNQTKRGTVLLLLLRFSPRRERETHFIGLAVGGRLWLTLANELGVSLFFLYPLLHIRKRLNVRRPRPPHTLTQTPCGSRPVPTFKPELIKCAARPLASTHGHPRQAPTIHVLPVIVRMIYIFPGRRSSCLSLQRSRGSAFACRKSCMHSCARACSHASRVPGAFCAGCVPKR